MRRCYFAEYAFVENFAQNHCFPEIAIVRWTKLIRAQRKKGIYGQRDDFSESAVIQCCHIRILSDFLCFSISLAHECTYLSTIKKFSQFVALGVCKLFFTIHQVRPGRVFCFSSYSSSYFPGGMERSVFRASKKFALFRPSTPDKFQDSGSNLGSVADRCLLYA